MTSSAKSFLCLLLSSLLVLSLSLASFAEELEQSRERLAELQAKIDDTLEGLRDKRVESGVLIEDLARLDAETRRVEKLVLQSDRQMNELSRRLKKQRQLMQELKQQKQATETQVSKRLVVLYKSGEVGLVRALLSEAETPREIAEKYVFLTRMVRHDRELLAAYREQAVAYEAALSELEVLREKQSSVVKRRHREQDTLRAAQKGKQKLLAELKQDETLLEGLLQELRAKAARLNDLVNKLETAQAQIYTEDLAGLSALKGQLPWPVPGKVMVGFGKGRHGALGTLIESHGLEIEAANGSSVRAIAAGRVLFANNLRGYGKLMIVDHGAKDYSLYAHLSSFAKQVGAQVSAGETIASSGSENRDSVYFEIRHGGKPLDPKAWLMPR